MKYKGSIVFFITAGIVLLFLFIWQYTGDEEKRSTDILEEFKKVDESLTMPALNIDSAKQKLLDSLAAKLSK